MNGLKGLLGRTYRAPLEEEEGLPARKTPAEINAERNHARLRRIAEISDGVDGTRSGELADVNGENVTGKFQAGEYEDSPEARERRAELENEQAEQALREAEARAAEDENEDETERARRLQAEGVEDSESGSSPGRGASEAEAGDEKVVNGVRYYLTVVNGTERWLTLKQLREEASKTAAADVALQRAQEALQRASQAALSPKDEPVEVSDADLENVVLSAMMGDSEAVRKLVSVIKPKPSAAPADVSRLVTQQIATQRVLESAESEQKDILGNDTLGPIFRQRLTEFARQAPDTKIVDAYRAVGQQMRKDFAPMLGPPRARDLPKADRKRTIVNPPQGAGRQPAGEPDDREVPVSSVIDQMAKARGQERAIRRTSRS